MIPNLIYFTDNDHNFFSRFLIIYFSLLKKEDTNLVSWELRLSYPLKCHYKKIVFYSTIARVTRMCTWLTWYFFQENHQYNFHIPFDPFYSVKLNLELRQNITFSSQIVHLTRRKNFFWKTIKILIYFLTLFIV